MVNKLDINQYEWFVLKYYVYDYYTGLNKKLNEFIKLMSKTNNKLVDDKFLKWLANNAPELYESLVECIYNYNKK